MYVKLYIKKPVAFALICGFVIGVGVKVVYTVDKITKEKAAEKKKD